MNFLALAFAVAIILLIASESYLLKLVLRASWRTSTWAFIIGAVILPLILLAVAVCCE